MNTATVIGRAGQDAEIRYFESGKVKTTFSLAVNRWDSKSKENVTESKNPEMIPGKTSGIITFLKATPGVAPKSNAASYSFGSIC